MDRKSGIGGSDCAAVMGLSRWKTPYQIWQEKIIPPCNILLMQELPGNPPHLCGKTYIITHDSMSFWENHEETRINISEEQLSILKCILKIDENDLHELDQDQLHVILAITGHNPSDKEEVIDNDSMRWGRALEPLIVKEYQERTGNQVNLADDGYGKQIAFKSAKYPWLTAHIDGFVKDKSLLLEAKSTRFFSDDWGDEGTDKIPIEYLIQCAHYCVVLDDQYFKVEGVDIAALGSTSDFRLYHYTRNEKLEQRIIELTGKFWNENVLTREPPPVTHKDNIAEIYHDCVSGTVVADADTHSICDELAKVKGDIKALESQEEKLKSILQLTMKERDTLISTSGSVLATWKASESKRLNQKRLKESGLDISSYYDVSTTRRFLIK